MSRAPVRKGRTSDTGAVDPRLVTLRSLKRLGVPRAPRRMLMTGWPDAAVVELGRAEFKLKDVEWRGPDQTSQGPFDLIVAGDLFGAGRLAGAVRDARALNELLSDDGVAVIAVATAGCETGESRTLEPLLFPALAAAGVLGPEVAARAPLGPASWILLLETFGLAVTVDGYGASPIPPELKSVHQDRLAVYDDREATTGMLFIRAVKRAAR